MSVEEKEYTAEEERQSFSEAEHQDSPREHRVCRGRKTV